MALLEDVFGISIEVPKHTYVDRSGLDSTFTYTAGTSKHIVIHGPSKQGKTVLWKKNLSPNGVVIVRCSPSMTAVQVFESILKNLGELVVKSRESETGISAEPKIIPGFKGSKKLTTTAEVPGFGTVDIQEIARLIKKHQKRVVVEDFHYLPDEERRQLAFHLKSLGEEGCPFIIIGVWPGQNLLTMYNGDLRGRFQEFDLSWSEAELKEVITKGADALNFEISDAVAQDIVADCHGNVGLLNRVMEKLCLNYNISVTLTGIRPIKILDASRLSDVRSELCKGEGNRYEPFYELVGRGFRKRRNATEVYQNILNVILNSSDKELLDGIDQRTLFTRISTINSRTTLPSLSQALARLQLLQQRLNVTPPLIYYNKDSKKLHVAEPEFLFYRKYRQP